MIKGKERKDSAASLSEQRLYQSHSLNKAGELVSRAKKELQVYHRSEFSVYEWSYPGVQVYNNLVQYSKKNHHMDNERSGSWMDRESRQQDRAITLNSVKKWGKNELEHTPAPGAIENEYVRSTGDICKLQGRGVSQRVNIQPLISFRSRINTGW